MESIQVRESNSEVLIFLDRNAGDKLLALKDAIRLLQIEVLRESNSNSRSNR